MSFGSFESICRDAEVTYKAVGYQGSKDGKENTLVSTIRIELLKNVSSKIKNLKTNGVPLILRKVKMLNPIRIHILIDFSRFQSISIGFSRF